MVSQVFSQSKYGRRRNFKRNARIFSSPEVEIKYSGIDFERYIEKNVAGVTHKLSGVFAQRLAETIYRSMIMRMPRDTRKLRSSLKRKERSRPGKQVSSPKARYTIYVEKKDYRTRKLKGVSKRWKKSTTVHAAYYQEHGYTPHYIPRAYADVASKYAHGPKASIKISRSKPWMQPAIDKWMNNDAWLKRMLDKALDDLYRGTREKKTKRYVKFMRSKYTK